MQAALLALLAAGLVLIVLGVLLLCKHMRRPLEPEFQAAPRIGIVTMVTDQPDFAHWLEHHLAMVERVYLRVENAPEIAALVASDSRVYAETAQVDAKERGDNYFGQMDRQRGFVTRMLDKAARDGLDVLFHIDADELIAVQAPHSSLGAELLRVPRGTACVHLHNHEAYFHDNQRCFSAAGFLDCQREACTSYGNGKSAAVLRHGPRYHGPHHFLGRAWQMPADRVVVLHFDSCTFDQWKSKFQRMAQKTTRTSEIPFPFYKQSIDKVQSGAADAELQTFYRERKWR